MEEAQEKSNLVEVVFVLDRSGSMSGLESDTIGGFNSMIRKQKNECTGRVLVTTVLFDDAIETLHDRIKIEAVPTLTDKEYFARGSTALLDAVGSTILHISNIHRYARKEDIPAKTLFVITTDGYENASHQYSRQKVKSMIEEQKEKNGWEFLFLGANIDAFDEAESLGINRDYAANVINDSQGVRASFDSVVGVVECCSLMKPISKTWKKKIDDDMKRRGGKNN